MRNNSKIVLIGIAVTIVSAIVLPILFGDLANDPWTKWVYNYQALISAVFAIGAALITVNTMRDTDDKQEKRHQELMSLNLRREKIIARRAAHPQLEEIEDCIRDIIDINGIIVSSDLDMRAKILHQKYTDEIIKIINSCKDIIGREQIIEAKELLPPMGYRSIQISENIIKRIINNTERLHTLFYNYGVVVTATRETFVKYSQEITDDLDKLAIQLTILNGSIADMVDEYCAN